MEIGTSVDFRHGFAAADVAASGVRWVRTVLTDDREGCLRWQRDCHAVGLRIIWVVARESIGKRRMFARSARDYASWLGVEPRDVLQLGNEPDQHSPSSWTLGPVQLGRLIHAFRTIFPTAVIIGPGLASGKAAYLDRVDLSAVDAIALHPYGQRPAVGTFYSPTFTGFGVARELLDTYRRFGKPIWVTEFGGPASDWPSEHERAVYHSQMIQAMAAAGVEVACQFCWSDAMVPGFGMIDAQGGKLETYAAIADAA